jgi:hypothetical protein
MMIPCVGIVDSNTLSWDVLSPIPGNDDSVKCINFYSYLFSKVIMVNKVSFLYKWKRNIKNANKINRLNNKIFLLFSLLNKKKKNNIYSSQYLRIFSRFLGQKIDIVSYLSDNDLLCKNFIKLDLISQWNNNEIFPFNKVIKGKNELS